MEAHVVVPTQFASLRAQIYFSGGWKPPLLGLRLLSHQLAFNVGWFFLFDLFFVAGKFVIPILMRRVLETA